MSSRPWFLAAMLPLALAGCGGGGGGGGSDGGGGGGGGGGPVFEARGAEFDARHIEAVDAGPDPGPLPLAGQATYDGVALLSATSTGDLHGAVTMTADFAAATVSGGIADLRDRDDALWAGTLDLAPGTLGVTFDNVLSGTIAAPSGDAHDLGGTFRSGFHGGGQALIDGVLADGWACQGAVCVPLSGQLNAE